MAKWLGCLTRNPQCGGLKPTEDISYKNLKKNVYYMTVICLCGVKELQEAYNKRIEKISINLFS